jgi:hypothetical protein
MRGATYTPPEKEEAPVEKPADKPRVRARTKKGQFQPDDPATPENEAWEEPKE